MTASRASCAPTITSAWHIWRPPQLISDYLAGAALDELASFPQSSLSAFHHRLDVTLGSRLIR